MFWGRNETERSRLESEYELVSLDELKPWKENPRINRDAIPVVAELIKKHGFAGVIIATPDGTIRAGHTRFEALKLLGRTEVHVHWMNFPSEEAADDFALADNKSGEWADWDHAKLSKMFGERRQADLKELEKATGFKRQEIEWQGADAMKMSEIGDYEDEDIKFIVRISEIAAADKDEIFGRIQKALEGTDYEARVY